MSDSQTSAGESRPTSSTPVHIEQVQLDLLAPDPDQIRKHFDQEALQSLAESIKQNGLIQPIVVRPRGTLEAYTPGADPDFMIVAGERRYRAARMAGIESVPVIVREDLVGADIAVIQVIENLQREDLTLAETCHGVARLVDAMGFQKAREQLGKSEAWVSKHAGVEKLPEPIKQLVGEGKIDSVDVAKDLGALMELSPKKADAMMARIERQSDDSEPSRLDEHHPDRTVWVNGAHKKVRDLSPDEREALELGSRKYTDRNRPTRSEIRLELVEAKVQKQRTAERREERKAEAAKSKNDPKAAKKAAAEKNKKDRERDRLVAVKQINEACSAFSIEQTKRLNVASGFKEPTRGPYHWNGDPNVIVTAPHFSEYGQATPPANTNSVKFEVQILGTFPQVQAAAKVMGADLRVAVRFSGELTMIEAKKIADVLGSRARFTGGISCKGADLARLAQKKTAAKQAAKKAVGSAAVDTTVPAFLKACVKKSTIPTRRISPADLHAAYVAWCKTQKLEPISVKHNGWGRAIAAAGIEKVRSDGMWYVGIELAKS